MKDSTYITQCKACGEFRGFLMHEKEPSNITRGFCRCEPEGWEICSRHEGQVRRRFRTIKITSLEGDYRYFSVYSMMAPCRGDNEYVRQTVRGFSEGVKGVPIKYLRSVARDISERDIANIYPEMRSILDTIKSDSEDIVLISGSPRMFVEALGREIGATVSDGTHHYVARGVIHENRPRRKTIHEKDKHLTSICRSLGGQAISAYGDAMNDLPMLLSVPNPTAVNPLPGLREFAITEGWPIIDCHVLQDSN